MRRVVNEQLRSRYMPDRVRLRAADVRERLRGVGRAVHGILQPVPPQSVRARPAEERQRHAIRQQTEQREHALFLQRLDQDESLPGLQQQLEIGERIRRRLGNRWIGELGNW